MSYQRLSQYAPSNFIQYNYKPIQSIQVPVPRPIQPVPIQQQAPYSVRPIHSTPVSQIQHALPQKSQCSLGNGGCGANGEIASLMDPKFNLREVAKQLILLEDHLFQTEKRCLDCISKHSMTIEGYLQEAITLDKKQEHTQEINELLTKIVPLTETMVQQMKDGSATPSSYADCAQQLRALRKPICQKYTILKK